VSAAAATPSDGRLPSMLARRFLRPDKINSARLACGSSENYFTECALRKGNGSEEEHQKYQNSALAPNASRSRRTMISQTRAPAVDSAEHGVWPIILASAVGTMIEWYDFFIFWKPGRGPRVEVLSPWQ
jgi:hypothetical protein